MALFGGAFGSGVEDGTMGGYLGGAFGGGYIDGLGGSSGSVDLSDILAVRLVSGSQTVDVAEAGSILGEDGEDILDEDGNSISEEGDASLGVATPLMKVSTICSYVSVVAKPDNGSVIWIGGSDIAEGIGGQLYALGAHVHIPVDDVSKVYIFGVVGEGVTFFYGTSEEAEVDDGLTFEGDQLTFDGDSLTSS